MTVDTRFAELQNTGGREPTARHYLMCRPTYFDVAYAINPWMDPAEPVDSARAMAQWEELRRTFERLGHRVDLIDPEPGLPDMVFAANGALALGGRVLGARFRHAEREAEGAIYLDWFRQHRPGSRARPASAVNEGEGDFLLAGTRLLAGTGFRTDLAAHAEAAAYFDLPVTTLELVDPRFYHLDTALAVLDERTIAYYPEAFAPESRQVLRDLFPGAIHATGEDAGVFGLNAVSDGCRVVLPAGAVGLAGQLAERGYEPVPVDLSELRKSGGGPKCCTLEIHP